MTIKIAAITRSQAMIPNPQWLNKKNDGMKNNHIMLRPRQGRLYLYIAISPGGTPETLSLYLS